MSRNNPSRFTIRNGAEKLQENGLAFFFFAVGIIALMGLVTVAVFFTFVKGAEEVMVPQVVGKELSEALIELQVKELYPKVSLRYSENPDDKGKILDQSPVAGSIVKAEKRINLTVSRGTVVDKVEDFAGWGLEDVRSHLKSLFAGTVKPLITLSEPLYDYSEQPAGVVLAQEPKPGTPIGDPITLKLVVSRGPENEKVSVPNLAGLSLAELYKQMQETSLVFDFVSTPTEEKSAQVVAQGKAAGTAANQYERVSVTVALPSAGGFNAPVCGVFAVTLPLYPYPLDIKLEAMPANGSSYTVARFKHPGGELTVPYSVPKNTVLVLSVQGSEVAQITAKNEKN